MAEISPNLRHLTEELPVENPGEGIRAQINRARSFIVVPTFVRAGCTEANMLQCARLCSLRHDLPEIRRTRDGLFHIASSAYGKLIGQVLQIRGELIHRRYFPLPGRTGCKSWTDHLFRTASPTPPRLPHWFPWVVLAS